MSKQLKFDADRLAAQVPSELRDRLQWVTWRYVVRDGKSTKAPVNPKTGDLADATNSATWGSYDQAVKACLKDPRLAGIGFVFTSDDPYCGIDLDHAIDPQNDALKPWAAELVKQLDSYTEVSPSRNGLKIFIRAQKPGRRCKKSRPEGAIEIYDRERFFTVTGLQWPGTDTEIQHRQPELTQLYESLFGPDDVHTLAPPPAASSGPPPLTDDEIIAYASKQRRSGSKFRDLWSGKWNEYFNSPSEADSSLVFTLAFYTKEAAQIDRLFRASGLMRSKWDEHHGQFTYGEGTISKALSRITRQFEPRAGKKLQPASKAVMAISNEPTPGTIDAASQRVILSTTRTLPTASTFVDKFYNHVDGHTLVHYAGLTFAWRGGRYTEIEDNALRQQLLTWLHHAVRPVFSKTTGMWELQDFPANPHTVHQALDSIKAFTHLPATTECPAWLSSTSTRPEPSEIVSCRTKLLHLPTMASIPATPQFFTQSGLDFDPDPNAPVPERWHEFLHQLVDGDCQSFDLVQEWFGYCLTADTSQQKMLLIVGPKRSGKGTLARVLNKLIGAANVCGPTTSSLAGPFGLQPLIGKSLAIVSDARFSGDGISTVVERLLCISGEDAITVDRKHLSSVTLKLPTRFLFLTNELPRFHDSSGALAGRFLMLRLTESFYGRENLLLTDQLLEELPGIFNWAVAGWKQLRSRGRFEQPEQSTDDVQEMQDLSSPVAAFVSDRCTVDPLGRVEVASLYESWRHWCSDEGYRRISTRQNFGRDLAAVVPSIRKRRNHQIGVFYEGLSLRSSDSHEWPSADDQV